LIRGYERFALYPNSWQRGQMKLLVLPVLIFSIGAAQAGHGWPSL